MLVSELLIQAMKEKKRKEEREMKAPKWIRQLQKSKKS